MIGADVSATQSELISPVTAVRAAHGKIARHLHTAARPPGHERESTELLIRTLSAHPAGPPVFGSVIRSSAGYESLGPFSRDLHQPMQQSRCAATRK
ncbi:unnamed protein product [Pleuronectes platessa]|uniref:Uncharacterized protein n=1 Tax=Pleuronectes platessa TaxID=8262 RepID=A0A9N7YR39_PLEPL|nr:unnamed protein product [Pleuronectes platessa]